MQCISVNRAAVFRGNTEDIRYSFISRHCILNYTMFRTSFLACVFNCKKPKNRI